MKSECRHYPTRRDMRLNVFLVLINFVVLKKQNKEGLLFNKPGNLIVKLNSPDSDFPLDVFEFLDPYWENETYQFIRIRSILHISQFIFEVYIIESYWYNIKYKRYKILKFSAKTSTTLFKIKRYTILKLYSERSTVMFSLLRNDFIPLECLRFNRATAVLHPISKHIPN